MGACSSTYEIAKARGSMQISGLWWWLVVAVTPGGCVKVRRLFRDPLEKALHVVALSEGVEV